MDLVTHGLLGATLAQATATEGTRLPPRERLALGAIAAILPDIDFVGFLINPLLFLADWHQGPTHLLVLLPLWAILMGGAYVMLRGRRPAFVEAALVSPLGLASHIGADLITATATGPSCTGASRSAGRTRASSRSAGSPSTRASRASTGRGGGLHLVHRPALRPASAARYLPLRPLPRRLRPALTAAPAEILLAAVPPARADLMVCAPSGARRAMPLKLTKIVGETTG